MDPEAIENIIRGAVFITAALVSIFTGRRVLKPSSGGDRLNFEKAYHETLEKFVTLSQEFNQFREEQTTQNEALKKSNLLLAEELGKTKESIVLLNTANMSLNERHATERSEWVERYRAQIVSHADKVADYASQNTKLHESIAALQKQVDALQKEVTALATVREENETLLKQLNDYNEVVARNRALIVENTALRKPKPEDTPHE